MSTENRVIDLVIDENVPYGLLMQFMDVDESVYPNTSEPVDLTGFTVKGTIKDSLEDNGIVLANFNTAIIDAKQGVASISLPASAIKAVAAKASKERDRFNPRQRFAGYYDVIMTRTSVGSTSSSFRIMEGKVFISDGVTE